MTRGVRLVARCKHQCCWFACCAGRCTRPASVARTQPCPCSPVKLVASSLHPSTACDVQGRTATRATSISTPCGAGTLETTPTAHAVASTPSRCDGATTRLHESFKHATSARLAQRSCGVEGKSGSRVCLSVLTDRRVTCSACLCGPAATRRTVKIASCRCTRAPTPAYTLSTPCATTHWSATKCGW